MTYTVSSWTYKVSLAVVESSDLLYTHARLLFFACIYQSSMHVTFYTHLSVCLFAVIDVVFNVYRRSLLLQVSVVCMCQNHDLYCLLYDFECLLIVLFI